MVERASIRCENLACLCDVPADEATCSAYCASPSGRDATDIRCACGHTACAEAIDEQLHGDAGRESA